MVTFEFHFDDESLAILTELSSLLEELAEDLPWRVDEINEMRERLRITIERLKIRQR